MTPDLITPELLEPHVRPLLGTDPAHDWQHIVRVFRLGVRLFGLLRAEAGAAVVAGESSTGDRVVWGGWPEPTPDDEAGLRVALVGHDLGKKVDGRPNELLGDSDLRPVLDGLGVSEAAFAVALDAINGHSWRRGLPPRSLASAIVQDADRLDAIGAVGVARCFAYGGHLGRPIHDTERPEGGSLSHFREKLLLIHDRLNLAVSQALAEERHRFLVEFEARFLGEFNAER